MDLSQSTTKWLALGMLRSSEVASLILQRFQLQDFRDDESSLKMAFVIMERWHSASKTAVPLPFALSVLQDEIIPNKVLSEMQALEFGNLLMWVYTEIDDAEQYKSFVLDQLNQFVIDRKIRPAAAGLDRQQNLVESLQELNKAVAKTAISKATIIDPFAHNSPMLNTAQRIPWGVDWVDVITSGGALPGETTLLLAPSGGGKTLTNIQMATTVALQGDEALIITYEQGYMGIANRIYAFAMGLPLNTFNGLSEISFNGNKVLQARYEEVRRKLAGKIKIVDQLDAAQNSVGGGCGGAEEIEHIIKNIQDQGGRPRYVGLDWLGPMVNNYMSTHNLRDNDITKVMNAMADSLRKVGAKVNVNMWVYHQLGTEAAKSGPRKKPDSTDAYMCKTLHHYMDTVIAIGNRDKESNIAWASAPKVRNGQPFLDMMIQMDGALSRWKLVDRTNVNSETMKMYGEDQEFTPEAKPRQLVKASANADFNDSVRAHLG